MFPKTTYYQHISMANSEKLNYVCKYFVIHPTYTIYTCCLTMKCKCMLHLYWYPSMMGNGTQEVDVPCNDKMQCTK